MRESHRADLHQALAYAAMADVETVDSVLAYPALAEDPRPFTTVARCRRVAGACG